MNFHQSHQRTSARLIPIKFEHLEDRRLLSAYLGAAFTINQKIEAEFFDLGGEGVGYHDTTAANLGGALRPTEAVDISATTDTGGSKDPTPYGTTFKKSDLAPIAARDLPFGMPKWMGNGETAKRLSAANVIAWKATAPEG